MPNHVHVLIRRTMRSSLAEIVRAWKGVSARRIDQALGLRGPFWFRDYFDRDIREDEEHLDKAIRYVELNPVKAGLCTRPQDWPFSSARCSRRWRGDVEARPAHTEGAG
jgi:REP element-mobilizing transposase RayT